MKGLGPIQKQILAQVQNEAAAWLADAEIAYFASEASMTLIRLSRNLPGLTGKQLLQSANKLVASGQLKKTKVGWALSDNEFARVKSANTPANQPPAD